MEKSTDEEVQDMIEYLNGQSEKNDKSADPYLAEFAKLKPPFRFENKTGKFFDASNQEISPYDRNFPKTFEAIRKIVVRAYVYWISFDDIFDSMPAIMNEFWELYVLPQLPKESE